MICCSHPEGGGRGNQHPEKKEEKQKHRKYCETDIIPIVMSGGYIGHVGMSACQVCPDLFWSVPVFPGLSQSV